MERETVSVLKGLELFIAVSNTKLPLNPTFTVFENKLAHLTQEKYACSVFIIYTAAFEIANSIIK